MPTLAELLQQRRSGVDPLTGQSRPQPFTPQMGGASNVGQGLASAGNNIARALIARRRQQDFEQARQEAAQGLAGQLVASPDEQAFTDNARTTLQTGQPALRSPDPMGRMGGASEQAMAPGLDQQAFGQAQDQTQQRRQQLMQALQRNPQLAQVAQAAAAQQQFGNILGGGETQQQGTILEDPTQFGFREGTVVQQTPDGEFEVLQEPQEAGGQAGTLTERQVSRLSRRSDVQRLSKQLGRNPRDVAADLHSGRLRIEVVDTTGNVRLIDEVSQTVRELPIEAGDLANVGAQDRTQERTGQGEQTAGTERGQQIEQRVEEIPADELFGPGAVGGAIVDQALGFIDEGLQSPNIRESRTAFRIGRVLASRALRSSNRVSDRERQEILSTLPSIDNPLAPQDSSVRALDRFVEEMRNIQRSEEDFADDPNNPSTLRREARNRVRTIQRVIDNFNRIQGVGEGDQRSERGGGPPPQAIRQMGREQLNQLSEDTSQLTDEQLRAAAERFEQLESQ